MFLCAAWILRAVNGDKSVVLIRLLGIEILDAVQKVKKTTSCSAFEVTYYSKIKNIGACPIRITCSEFKLENCIALLGNQRGMRNFE